MIFYKISVLCHYSILFFEMSTSRFVTYSSLCNTTDTETYLTEIQIQSMINPHNSTIHLICN